MLGEEGRGEGIHGDDARLVRRAEATEVDGHLPLLQLLDLRLIRPLDPTAPALGKSLRHIGHAASSPFKNNRITCSGGLRPPSLGQFGPFGRRSQSAATVF